MFPIGGAVIELILGKTYKRSDLHDTFGGNRQSGISRTKTGIQVLVFSNERGGDHGYEGGWDESGLFFYYTGAGQQGDQDLESSHHNDWILGHQENGDAIRLFTGTDKSGYYTYDADLTLVDYEFFQTVDTNGRNRRAVKFTLERLSDTPTSQAQTHRAKTLQKSPSYRPPGRTARRGLVTSRVGQGYYRQQLLQRFNFRCAVTGCGLEEILFASHIVPWRDATDDERLDVDNGILLSPAYDALFDKHLTSFNFEGKIQLASTLTKGVTRQLGIDVSVTISVSDGMKPYLKRHRENLR